MKHRINTTLVKRRMLDLGIDGNADLAHRMNYSRSGVSKLINNKMAYIPFDRVASLAEALHLSLDELIVRQDGVPCTSKS